LLVLAIFKGENMEVKLYVGNLSFSTSDDDLRDLFAQAGTVKSATVIKDRDTGQSRGFAFVEMDSQVEAEKAISMFNGYKFENRELKVNLARPREERSSGGGGYRSDYRRDSGSRSNRSGGQRRY
jgi:cold-inducible RNA-binding protein